MPKDSDTHSGLGVEASNQALNKIAKSGAANLGAAVLGSGANFLLIVLVTRFWPAADAGLLFAATSFFLIAIALAHFGADQGLVRFIAWNVGRGAGHTNKATVISGMLPALGITVLVASLGYVFAPQMALLFGAGSVAQGTQVVRVLALTLPIAVLYEQFLAICRGYAAMRPTIIVERALRPTVQMILILIAGLSKADVVLLAVAWAVPYLLCLCLAVIALRRTLKGNAEQWEGPGAHNANLRGEFWRFTAPRGLARIAQVMIQRADIVLVTILLGPAEAAIYTAATRFLVLGQVATSALQQVSEPQLAGLLAKQKFASVTLIVRQMTVWSVVLVWPIYFIFAVHAHTLMSWIFGPGYEAGGAVLQLLSVAMLVATAIGPMDVLLLMAGKSILSLMNATVALAIDLMLCLILIPTMGIFGAGIAWAAAIIVKNLMCLWQVKKYLAIHVFSRNLAMWLISLTVLFGVMGVLSGLLPGQPWVGVSFSFLTGVFYLGFLWVKKAVLLPRSAVK